MSIKNSRDYLSYIEKMTVAELKQLSSTINIESYPERYKLINELILKKSNKNKHEEAIKPLIKNDIEQKTKIFNMSIGEIIFIIGFIGLIINTVLKIYFTWND